MASLQEINDVLQREFPDVLLDPLEQTPEGRITGFIISSAFDDLDHFERQDLLWEVLNRALSADQLRNVGPVAVLTPIEAEIKAADRD